MTQNGATVTSAGSFRTELHGLRAIAILMVACYHIWIGRVSGGIDIFLLISSFLLMQTFLRRLDTGRPLGVPDYWLRAFRRLLPPAVITILGTFAAVYAFFPPERIREVINQSIASLLYYQNWYLAENQFDYYADKSVVSPLQHFWSLSIQGQIFILWPVIIWLCWWVAKRTKTNTRAWLAGVFGAIFVASLAWSIYQTATNQQYAYFSTWTRLWEFSLGALFALVLPWIERRLGYGPGVTDTSGRGVLMTRVLLGWAGLIAILACGLVLDVEGLFPGYVALWPTLAALVVLAAGNTGVPFAADRLLSSRPLQFLGNKSYALYLVHWPVLIATMQLTGADRVRLSQGVFVLVISLALATILTDWVDAPIRYSTWLKARRRRSIGVIVVSLIAGLVPLFGYQAHLDAREARIRLEAQRNNPGALVLSDEILPVPNPDAPLLPLPENHDQEWASLEKPCEYDIDWVEGAGCGTNGHPGTIQAVAIGNSRLEQYLPFLDAASKEYGWHLTSLLKGGCPLLTADQSEIDKVVAEHCVDWYPQVYEYLDQVEPDMVILVSTRIDFDHTETVMPGMEELIADFTSRGIDVFGLRDQPRLPEETLECLQETRLASGTDFQAEMLNSECAVTREAVGYAEDDPAQTLWGEQQGEGQLYLYDPSWWLCPDDCPLVIGNVYVYMDDYHITKTYSETMSTPVIKDLDVYFGANPDEPI